MQLKKIRMSTGLESKIMNKMLVDHSSGIDVCELGRYLNSAWCKINTSKLTILKRIRNKNVIQTEL